MKIALIIFMAALFIASCGTSEDWQIVDSGRFYQVDYEMGDRGAITIIRWEDGHTIFIGGLQKIEYIFPGDSVEIYENINSDYYNCRIIKR